QPVAPADHLCWHARGNISMDARKRAVLADLFRRPRVRFPGVLFLSQVAALLFATGASFVRARFSTRSILRGKVAQPHSTARVMFAPSEQREAVPVRELDAPARGTEQSAT